jgi:hypothetical protein
MLKIVRFQAAITGLQRQGRHSQPGTFPALRRLEAGPDSSCSPVQSIPWIVPGKEREISGPRECCPPVFAGRDHSPRDPAGGCNVEECQGADARPQGLPPPGLQNLTESGPDLFGDMHESNQPCRWARGRVSDCAMALWHAQRKHGRPCSRGRRVPIGHGWRWRRSGAGPGGGADVKPRGGTEGRRDGRLWSWWEGLYWDTR